MASSEAVAPQRPAIHLQPAFLLAAGLALLALLTMLALVGAALQRIVTNAFDATGDFLSFYSAGQMVRSGQGADLYNAAAQEALQRVTFPGIFEEAMGFPLPVFAAWVFAPFSLLPFTPAFLLWMGLNTLLLAALVGVLSSHLAHVPALPRRVFLAVFAFSMPAVTAIIFGQVDLIVFGAFLLAYLLLRAERPVAAGFALSLVLFKPHFLVGVVLMLLVWRQWRVLAALAGIGVPLITVPALLTSPATLAGNLSLLGQYLDQGKGLSVNAELMSNWRGFVTSLTGHHETWLWMPGLALIAAAALAIAVSRWRRGPGDREALGQSYALAVALPLLISPHLHTQSLVLIFIAAAIALRNHFDRAVPSDVDSAKLVCWMLSLYTAVFALWFVATQGLALMVFLLLFMYWLCAYRWTARPASEISLPASARRSELRAA
jgi:hypothetical protein